MISTTPNMPCWNRCCRPSGRTSVDIPGPAIARRSMASSSRAVRAAIRLRHTRPVIPHRKLPDGSYPPEAAGFDKPTYRRRNVVERLFGRLKEFRRIATRYEKLAESFVAMILLGFIRICLHDLLAYRP